VAGTAAADGTVEEEAGMAGFAATAVVASTPQGIIDGTAAGVGGAVAGIRGGSFRFQCLTRTTADITVQAMDTDMDRVTVTDTEHGGRQLITRAKETLNDQPGSPDSSSARPQMFAADGQRGSRLVFPFNIWCDSRYDREFQSKVRQPASRVPV
jgi:hypothetical protein